jgi:superfamily II DNA or RNA helicase
MPSVIKIQNCYSWLLSDNEKVKTDLWKALRVPELNYQHSRLYKQRLWDGYTDFFKKESGRFLTGLLPEVQGALKYWNIDYTIIDERNQLKFQYNEIKPDFLQQWAPKGTTFNLYDYQVDIVNQVLKHHRGIVSAATGAGKTEIMISILKTLPPNTPTLILANKKSLVNENYLRLEEWGFKNFGRLYDKYVEPNVFTCATVQSLHKIEKLLPHIRCVIVDEIHDMMSKLPKKYYNKLKNASVRVAVSATWEKFGGRDKSQRYSVKGHFGPVFKTNCDVAEGGVVKTKKLQERGTLSQSKCIFYPIREPALPYDVYLDAVTNGIANNLHFHDVVRNLTLKCKGRTLILVERIAHGDMLQKIIPDAFWVAGRDDINTRREVIEKLQKASKEDAVAIATQGIFNAGINVHLHNLINAAGGQAEHIIIQRMGRGLRTAGDKDILHYYDFVFEINDYLLKHSKKLIRILKKEGHEVIVKENLDD